jgi:D-glycero-D-manno-heptose 1,7-bisphosphate phosphatase
MLRAGPDGRWTVFLDRDGTINRKAPEGEYVRSPEALDLLDGAAAAIARLRSAGARVVVVTNQRGVALGRMTLADLEGVHQRLHRELAAAGTEVDAIYSCPHDLDACDCRKPGPGLFLQAVDQDPSIDLGASAMVGDSSSDIQAGARFGMVTVLLMDPSQVPDGWPVRPDHVARALDGAVDWLLARAPEVRLASPGSPEPRGRDGIAR